MLGILISFSITTLPFYLNKNKFRLSKIFLIITILVYFLLFTISYVNNENWLLDSFMIASFVFFFLWIIILIYSFTKIALNYKISISLFNLAFITVFTNPFCSKVLNISNNDNNIPNLICAIIMIIIALSLIFKQLFNKKD